MRPLNEPTFPAAATDRSVAVSRRVSVVPSGMGSS